MYLLEDTPEAADLRRNVVNLLASPDVDNALLALQLIKAGGMHPDFVAGLCAHVITENWRYNEEQLPFKKFWEKQRLFSPKQRRWFLKECSRYYYWSDLTEIFAKRAQKKTKFFLAPHWKEIALLGYRWKESTSGMVCAKYGIIPVREYLESIIEEKSYVGQITRVLNLSYTGLGDLQDELADMRVDTLHLWSNPLEKIRRKHWQNPYIQEVTYNDTLPMRAVRVLYQCFPAYTQKLLKKNYKEQSITLLKFTPKEQRGESFYKKCAEQYKKEGNHRMALFCYKYLLKHFPYPEECLKLKIAGCYALLRDKAQMLHWLQAYIAETPYDARKDVHLSPEFDRYRKSRELNKLLKSVSPSVYFAPSA